MDSRRPAAKYQLIESILAGRIREGVYDEPGLPGERELAQEFGAARITVRTALQRLQDQGLVERRQRRGTVAISGLGAARPKRLLREVVNQFLDRGRDDDIRRVLAFGSVKATPRVAEALNLAAGTPVLRVVRVRSDGDVKLTYTETFLAWPLAAGITRAGLERHAYVKLLEGLGVEVGMAEQTVGSEAAPAVVAAALGLPPQSPILKLTRVIYDHAESPVQLLYGWYRADHFEIAMQLSRSTDSTKVWVRCR